MEAKAVTKDVVEAGVWKVKRLLSMWWRPVWKLRAWGENMKGTGKMRGWGRVEVSPGQNLGHQ
jgi:hypothetical protein